jgi:membrane protein YdbS with pleckstrin-like domain
MDKPSSGETIKWKAYPSWAHFSWLYLFSLWTGLRGILFIRLGISGWEFWIAGAVVLLLCVVILRRWGEYILTSRRVIIRNGFTLREIDSITIEDISNLNVKQGPLGRFFEFGTLIVESTTTDQVLSLRGIRHPTVICARLNAMRPSGKDKDEVV